MDNALILERTSKSFGPLEILRDINLTVASGERVAILGPSGSGKSTLLHVAGLMEQPTSGRVFLQGTDATALSERERAERRLRSIGFLFQFHYLLPDFDVLENALIPIRLASTDLRAGEVKARSLLDRLGLSARLHHRPHQLSGGEQQRAALARALMNQPSLLLCDEPTGNLDAKTAKAMMSLLWDEARRQNLAMIVVTHNEELAGQVDFSYHLVDGILKKTV